MTSLSKFLLVMLASGSLIAVAPRVQATPIQGQIDFNGVVTFDTMSLASATRVNLWNSSFVIPGSQSGDFSSIANFTNVAMTAPWIFNSGTPGSPLPGPATPALWSVGGFTFDLSSSMIIQQSSQFLSVQGIGTLKSTNPNLDPTPATWSFTVSRGDGGTSTTFGFQAQTTAVPEPASLALLGIGAACAGLRALARRNASVS